MVSGIFKLMMMNNMMFDMKQARDANTTSNWTNSIFRLFIDDKLFVSNYFHSCFSAEADAWTAFFSSTLWTRISEYVDYCQKFFNKTEDWVWRREFEKKIIEKLNITVKEYVER